MKKNFLTRAAVCLIVFLLMLGCAVFLAARPISYNMRYYGETEDEYGFFAASRYYTRGDYVLVENTNFDLPLVDFYYYKDGYAFDLRADTDEQYAEEIEQINSRWEEALEVDFYAKEINAYRMIFNRPDGATMIYLCRPAIVLTAVAATAALIFAGLSCIWLVGYQKARKEEEQAAE